ncbi:PREDICTED: acyltransferase-like protein At1g54570, chloroplastic [Populus euphratica]|uniref:Acyltransferase-like protein At1g54570, chloroplastic n=1 Tax=Populus euphratica TaxID=75702 RepID=A0AAJ6UN63_POPEU|nr:PREDICTED: acyltransferase-like protein At1g54570, chloroplastic [Populus euphratica]
MPLVVNSLVLPYFVTNSEAKLRSRVRVQSLGSGRESKILSSDSIPVKGTSIEEKEKNGDLVDGFVRKIEKSDEGLIDGGNGRLKYTRVEKKRVKDVISNDLEVLWDDGYGTKTVRDYLEGAKEIIRPDGGPPRWFCPVECGQPLKDSPILLFFPGIDGVGLGLTLHHKALGKVFEVRCLHIPVYDRTPFEGLVKFVEKIVRLEHASSPNKPIYLVGDSFGGCLALAVAARNPAIDLVLILANPATSFNRSQLQPLFPLLEALPDEFHNAVPYLLSFVMGDPVKMAMVNIESKLPPRLQIEQLSNNLTAMLPSLSGLADIIPKDTLLWKLKLLKSAAAYANSRLHSVKAEVLVLSSGKDQMLPSGDESKRLKSSLKNCTVRHFKENGHTILLEDGVNLLTIIKGTSKYRRSRRLDFVSNYLPPSMSEFKRGFEEVGLLQTASSAAMFSTLDDGNIVRGLGGVPNEGPVLLVGYHMLLGLELSSLVEAFLREKNIMVRGMAHPMVFTGALELSSAEFSVTDWMKVMGAVPVTASNIYKLLSTNSHVLLYPGGVREAFHYRGEEYKLIWPKQQEFVRMAARFGATIVPFGAVGEDDIAELVLDYKDLMKIPVVNGYVRDATRKSIKIRDENQGEVANQVFYMPGLLPKVPGRFYFLFGKPVETKGKGEILEDRENANQLYLHIKSEVESCLAYLLKKREDDPCRSIIDRTVYRALRSPSNEVPAFDP